MITIYDAPLAKKHWREYFAIVTRLDGLKHIRGRLSLMRMVNYEDHRILEDMLAREIHRVEADAEACRQKALNYIKSEGL